MLALSSQIVPIHSNINDRDDDRIAIGPVPVEIPSIVGNIPRPPSLEQQQEEEEEERHDHRRRYHPESSVKRSTKKHFPSSLRSKIPTARQILRSTNADEFNMIRWNHDHDLHRGASPWSLSQTSAVGMPIEEEEGTSRRSSQTFGATVAAGPSSPSISVQISRNELHRRRRLEEEDLLRHQEADYRDYIFYSRVMSGVQRSCHNSLVNNHNQGSPTSTEHFEENRRCLQHIISTRHDDDDDDYKNQLQDHDRTMQHSQVNHHGAFESKSETEIDSNSMLWMHQSLDPYQDHETPRNGHGRRSDVDEGGNVDDEGEGEDDCIFEMDL